MKQQIKNHDIIKQNYLSKKVKLRTLLENSYHHSNGLASLAIRLSFLIATGYLIR